MTDDEQAPAAPEPEAAPQVAARPAPMGHPRAARAARLTRDPVCTSYG
jgi:hypothetical protein